MSSIGNLPGYKISQHIYAGTRHSIYRGKRERDNLPVIIKIIRAPLPSAKQIAQLRHQYTITRNLDLPGVPTPLAFETYQNAYALVTEDLGGISLKDYLQQEGAFGASRQQLELFLHIAIQLAEILAGLYERRVIHKDIKPANIIFNPQTRQIYPIDFSVASLLPQETVTLQHSTALEGTLAYIAPEQTGRINRCIDYRSDFYALGITFYELLTGELPFPCQDPLEVVYSHLARIATPVDRVRSEIPKVLSDLTGKLMSKNAEDRYQNALGIKSDLEMCLTQLQATGRIDTFELGTKDLSDRFAISNRIYGREVEITALLDTFDRISKGSAEMILVTGHSGSGKTAIVKEIYKPIARERAYFVAGKFEQFQRSIPFSAVARALEELVGKLFYESPAQLQVWKEKILAAVGNNGQILIEIAPDLERIIGNQQPAAELSGSAAQQRFYLTFQKFIRLFATAEHPLVIFFDDLQWADLASIDLLELLLQDTSHLLIVGAYRNNEVSATHPLAIKIAEIQTMGAIVNTIDVPPLEFSALNRLVADTLHCGLEKAEPLTKLVTQKTQGNPFFATQFLKSLHQGGQITFDRQSSGWRCDLARVRTLAITDDVVEFMALQLQQLPPATQELMKLAACIGTHFDLHTLAIVSEYSFQDLAVAIWKALEAGLVIPTTEMYKFFAPLHDESHLDPYANPTYQFIHDRVQQAAYSLIPDREKPTTNLKIGRLLQQNAPEKIFDIVEHLNRAITLITQPKERIDLAQLNLNAGKKARNATAYAAAYDLLQLGMKLLPKDSWITHYSLTLDLHIAAAEVAYLSGNLAQMEEICAVVLHSARDILDTVEVYRIKIAALTANGKMLEAIDIGIDALAQLGIDIPKQPDDNKTHLALQNLEKQLEGRQIEDLLDLPVMSDLKTQKTLQLFADLLPPTFISTPSLYPLFNCEMVSLSLKFGNAPVSAVGYVSHGLVLSALLGDVDMGYCFGELAMKLTNCHNSQEYQGKTLLVFANWIQHRREILRTVLPLLKDGYKASIEIGDFVNAGYNINFYFDANLLSSTYINDWEAEIADYCKDLARINQYSALAYLRMKQQVARNLLIPSSEAWCLIGDAYDETVMLLKHDREADLTALAYVYIYKLMLACIFDSYTFAAEYIAPAERYLQSLAGMMPIPVFHFYAALTRLAQLSQQTELERAVTLAQINAHQETIDLWAQTAPMNYRHKWQTIEAEKQRILGNFAAAENLYDLAIAGAKEHQFTHEEALANELAAKFYLVEGRSKIAQTYMMEAYYCYTRWGATAKSQQLIALYPDLLATILQPEQSDLSGIEMSIDVTVAASNSDVLDFKTLLQASQTIAQEVEIDRLILSLLNIISTNSGADKCVLILKEEEDWQVVAVVEGKEEPQLVTPVALDASIDVPASIVNVVRHHLQPLVAIGDEIVTRYTNEDGYLLHYQPQSLLCLPILHQGQAIGSLYLENHSTTSNFTPERIEILELLISQAAISIDNAKLYSQLRAHAEQLELKVIERTAQLQAAKELAEASEREKTNLFNNINHELRSPLNSILGLSEALLEQHKGLLNPQQIRWIETISKSGKHQLSLIEDILDYATIDAGKLELHREPTQIELLCDRSLSIVQHQADLKQIELKSQIPSDLPLLTIDERRICQVVINLLTNAIKFTPDGGRVSLEVTQLEAEGCEPAAVRVAVVDTGIGIEPGDLDRLFQPFVQIDSLEARKSKGTGLGLNLVEQIVAAHGGRVGVTSTPGSGSRFTVDLPYGNVAFSEPYPASKAASPTQFSYGDAIYVVADDWQPQEERVLTTDEDRASMPGQILIVDDDRDSVEIFSSYLAAKGYQISVAENGREAIERAKLESPQAIVMDIKMPMMNGIEAIAQLRADPQFSNLPIIAVTALALQGDRERCLTAGADRYLSKPVTLQHLSAILKQAIHN